MGGREEGGALFYYTLQFLLTPQKSENSLLQSGFEPELWAVARWQGGRSSSSSAAFDIFLLAIYKYMIFCTYK